MGERAMAEHNEYFTSESVDEQVEQLSQDDAGWQVQLDQHAGQALVQDLYRLYHTEREQQQRTLERAQLRLAERQSRQYSQKPKSNLQHHINTIAAVIIASLLVGSLLVVLHMTNNSRNLANRPLPQQRPAVTSLPGYRAGETIASYAVKSAVRSVDWSKNGQLLVATNDHVLVWNASGKQVLDQDIMKPSSLGAQLFTAHWSPDGTRIAVATPVLQIWDATGKVAQSCGASGNVQEWGNGFSGVPAVAQWSPDGAYIALVDRNPKEPKVGVWDAATCDQVEAYPYDDLDDIPFDVAWSPDGHYLAIARTDAIVDVWNFPAQDDKRHRFTSHYASNIFHIAWSPDGKRIASTSYGSNRVEVWDAMTGDHQVEYVQHTQEVSAIAWSPDSKWLASGSLYQNQKGEVHIWNPDTGMPRGNPYRENSRQVLGLAWSADGKRIASADGVKSSRASAGGGTIKIWATGN
jgi:WD40 repeat protein